MSQESTSCMTIARQLWSFRSDYGLLVAQNGDATLVEAVWILLGGDVKIDGEDEVRPGEVQVHGQSHLHRDTDGNKSVKVSPAEFL